MDLTLSHPGIDEPSIEQLVRAFYGRARNDELLGPIFASAVSDWNHHIHTITRFWCSIMLRTGNYDGRPLRPHLLLNLEGKHFDRWLALFEQTAREIFSDEIAAAFIIKARRIADSFEMAIGTQRGEVRLPRHTGS